jgi:hypothetical protein
MKTITTKNLPIETANDTAASAVMPLQMPVYREMADQPSQSVDVLAVLQQQFVEIERLQKKKIFLLKEISSYVKD